MKLTVVEREFVNSLGNELKTANKGDKLFIISGESDCSIWSQLKAALESALDKGVEIFFLVGPLITTCNDERTLDELCSRWPGFNMFIAPTREPKHGFLAYKGGANNTVLRQYTYHPPFKNRAEGVSYTPIRHDGQAAIRIFLERFHNVAAHSKPKYIELDKSVAEDFVNKLNDEEINFDFLTKKEILALMVYEKYATVEEAKSMIRAVPSAATLPEIRPILSSLHIH